MATLAPESTAAGLEGPKEEPGPGVFGEVGLPPHAASVARQRQARSRLNAGLPWVR
jgi:hypothetical protein